MGMTLEDIDEEWRAWLGYDGDATDGVSTEPLQPGALERAEEILVNVGLMPVLVLGGMVVVVLGLVRMVRAINVHELDDDVSPEEEYYGQDLVEDPDAEIHDEEDPETPFQP
jgi:hypothetical protein